MSLGSKIKELRNANGMTQKDLSEKLNVTAQAVSRWESDEVEPSVGTIKQMSAIFNVSIDELFGNQVEPKVVEVEKVVEKPVVVEKDVVVEKPVIVEKQVVVEKPVNVKQSIGICHYCQKPIYADDKYKLITGRVGRTGHYEHLYHQACLDQEAEDRKRNNASRNKQRLTLSFVLGPIVAAIVFAILLALTLGQTDKETQTQMIVVTIVGTILAFTMVSCFVIGNNFLLDAWVSIASWSVKFPGIIFSFSMDGLKFLILMKLLFLVLGVLISIAAVILATVVAGALSIFVYPYALVRNIKYRTEDQIDY